jgi:hypothetical protein
MCLVHRNGMAGLHGKHWFTFIRKDQTFPTILHSQLWYKRVLLLSVFASTWYCSLSDLTRERGVNSLHCGFNLHSLMNNGV